MKTVFSLVVAIYLILFCASAVAQNPTWTNDTGISNMTDVYTGNGRPTVTSAFYNNQVWIAYTSNYCPNGCEIKVASSAAPAPYSFTTPTVVSVPGFGVITSTNTPGLGVQNGFLYLTYNDISNNNWLTRSQDGVNWSTPYQLATGYSTTWAPSIAGDSNNPNRIYAGFSSSSTYTPVICAVYPDPSNLPNSSQSCLNFTALSQMNFNPGMIYWTGGGDGVLMAYEYRGNSHCLSGYILNPETGYSYDYDASQNCSDQTSVAPSLALYENHWLLAWGGNNSARAFNTRITDPGELDFIYKKTFNQGMNGSPNLLTVSPVGYYPQIANFYVWNGQVRYLTGTF